MGGKTQRSPSALRLICLMRVDPAYFALRARAPLRQNPSASGGFLSRRAVTVFAIAGKNRDRGGVAPCAAETVAGDCRRQDGRVVKSDHAAKKYGFACGVVGSLFKAPSQCVIPPDARRNACLQEHFDEAAHEPHRGEVSEARNPLARDRLQQTGRSLTFVRDDV